MYSTLTPSVTSMGTKKYYLFNYNQEIMIFKSSYLNNYGRNVQLNRNLVL